MKKKIVKKKAIKKVHKKAHTARKASSHWAHRIISMGAIAGVVTAIRAALR